MLASALVAWLVAASFPHGLVGDWKTVAAAPPSTTREVWTLALYKDGQYDFSLSHVLVFDEGKATVSGHRITFTERDAKGIRCRGKSRVGTYTWSVSGTTLTLKPIAEPCIWRRAILLAKPLTLHR